MERIEMIKSTLTFLFLIFANTEAPPTNTVEPTGSADNAQPCRGCDLNHADCIMGVCSCEPGWAGDYCHCAQTPNALCESQQPIANETLCSYFRPYAICYLTELLEKTMCHCSTYNVTELAAGEQLPNVELTSKDMSQMKICRFTLNNVTYDFVVEPSGATARYNVMIYWNMPKDYSYAVAKIFAIVLVILIVLICSKLANY